MRRTLILLTACLLTFTLPSFAADPARSEKPAATQPADWKDATTVKVLVTSGYRMACAGGGVLEFGTLADNEPTAAMVRCRFEPVDRKPDDAGQLVRITTSVADSSGRCWETDELASAQSLVLATFKEELTSIPGGFDFRAMFPNRKIEGQREVMPKITALIDGRDDVITMVALKAPGDADPQAGYRACYRLRMKYFSASVSIHAVVMSPYAKMPPRTEHWIVLESDVGADPMGLEPFGKPAKLTRSTDLAEIDPLARRFDLGPFIWLNEVVPLTEEGKTTLRSPGHTRPLVLRSTDRRDEPNAAVRFIADAPAPPPGR